MSHFPKQIGVTYGRENVVRLHSTVTVAGDDNITTEAQDDKVTVKLKKDLVVNSVEAGDTTVNNDGVKIAGGPSLTKSGIDAAGNGEAVCIQFAVACGNAVNGDVFGQFEVKGLNIAADNGNDDNVQLGETVAYRSSDKNIVTNFPSLIALN